MTSRGWSASRTRRAGAGGKLSIRVQPDDAEVVDRRRTVGALGWRAARRGARARRAPSGSPQGRARDLHRPRPHPPGRGDDAQRGAGHGGRREVSPRRARTRVTDAAIRRQRPPDVAFVRTGEGATGATARRLVAGRGRGARRRRLAWMNSTSPGFIISSLSRARSSITAGSRRFNRSARLASSALCLRTRPAPTRRDASRSASRPRSNQPFSPTRASATSTSVIKARPGGAVGAPAAWTGLGDVGRRVVGDAARGADGRGRAARRPRAAWM